MRYPGWTNVLRKVCGKALILGYSLFFAACGTTVPPALTAQQAQLQMNSMRNYNFKTLVADGYLTPLCPDAAPGQAHCNSLALTASGKRMFSSEMLALKGRFAKTDSADRKTTGTLPGFPGFTPSEFQAWYGLTPYSATYGTGKTVAIVIYGATTSLASDLAIYRSTYGLPACTVANGCFKILDENGGTNLPVNGGWEGEASLDTDMVSNICPLCKMIVLEAATATMSDMATANNTAASLKVSAISNSWGISETGMGSYASAFNHPGIPITAAAGNGEFSSIQEVPAAFSTVTSVGGTFPNVNPPYREGAWFGTVGCSTIVAKPAWQHDASCSTRTVADIGFQAAYLGIVANGAWSEVSGTSAGAPAIASIYAMTGSTVNDASALYSSSAGLYNVGDGFDGSAVFNSGGTAISCSAPPDYSTGVVNFFDYARRVMSANPLSLYLCTGTPGYNAPTGNGTPDGICGFGVSCTAPSPGASIGPCPIPTATPAGSHVVENPNAPGCGSS